jgi:hydroxyacylglutathione hydrolase
MDNRVRSDLAGLRIQSWTVGPFAENPYLLACAETGQAVFIDPGDEAPQLLRAIADAGVTVQAILLTHAHLDHVGALTELRQATGAPVYLHRDDDWLLEQAPAYWSTFGRTLAAITPADRALADGDRVSFGRCELQVIHTPGHTPGSVCFYAADDGLLIGGDTLFAGSIGRTDLPGGDTRTLLTSIRSRLWPLPEDTVVYPGHGEPTTIGDERRENPFVGQHAMLME